MTKVFIDTNVFLDMYRANLQSDISTLMGFLFKNKKCSCRQTGTQRFSVFPYLSGISTLLLQQVAGLHRACPSATLDKILYLSS